MPLSLDRLDIAILRTLMEDGRISYRQLAKRVGVTTPTVESRIRRMMDAGFIKGFAPVLDLTKVERGVMALVQLKVEAQEINRVLEALVSMEGVVDIFQTTGESNLTVRMVAEGLEELQRIIESRLAALPGVSVRATQVVTRVVKEGDAPTLKSALKITLECDYCGQEIASTPPHTLRVGEGFRFFCCKTCLDAYKKKYEAGIKRVASEL
jgi:DNA-binding Lrp family transcriptional regulator